MKVTWAYSSILVHSLNKFSIYIIEPIIDVPEQLST